MTTARSKCTPGKAGPPQAFSDKEVALSPRRQLTKGKGRANESAPSVPSRPRRAAALPTPTGFLPFKKIKMFRNEQSSGGVTLSKLPLLLEPASSPGSHFTRTERHAVRAGNPDQQHRGSGAQAGMGYMSC